MGWAWREIRDGKSFNAMLEMVSGVRDLGMEACVTAGMLTEEQASKLADAGLTAYNHNLDTSPEHYKNIITTRTYQDRLDTIKRVRNAGINVCCSKKFKSKSIFLSLFIGMAFLNGISFISNIFNDLLCNNKFVEQIR